MNIKLNPKFIEVTKGTNIVVLTEDEYEQILDALDAMEAERVLADKNDPALKWEDIHGTLIDNRIAEARKKRGITQKELATRMKVKQSYISQIENKDESPPYEIFKKVAKALSCKIDDLI